MYTHPFEVIKAHLLDKLPELREVDWYMNQDDVKDKDGWLVSSPAVYIQFLPSPTEDMGARIQSSTSEFDVLLLTDCVLAEGSKRIKKTDPKDHMYILDKIFHALSGFSALKSDLVEFVALAGTSADQRLMNSCTRISITPPHTPRKAIMKSVQRFRTKLYDHAAKNTYAAPDPSPDLELEVEV